jgi:hypothetical protein
MTLFFTPKTQEVTISDDEWFIIQMALHESARLYRHTNRASSAKECEKLIEDLAQQIPCLKELT